MMWPTARAWSSVPTEALIADARTPIELLEEHQGARLRPVGDQEEVDTLGRAGLRASPGACRSAARSSPTRRASNSKCSMPIRAGSSDCACAASPAATSGGDAADA